MIVADQADGSDSTVRLCIRGPASVYSLPWLLCCFIWHESCCARMHELPLGWSCQHAHFKCMHCCLSCTKCHVSATHCCMLISRAPGHVMLWMIAQADSVLTLQLPTSEAVLTSGASGQMPFPGWMLKALLCVAYTLHWLHLVYSHKSRLLFTFSNCAQYRIYAKPTNANSAFQEERWLRIRPFPVGQSTVMMYVS